MSAPNRNFCTGFGVTSGIWGTPPASKGERGECWSYKPHMHGDDSIMITSLFLSSDSSSKHRTITLVFELHPVQRTDVSPLTSLLLHMVVQVIGVPTQRRRYREAWSLCGNWCRGSGKTPISKTSTCTAVAFFHCLGYSQIRCIGGGERSKKGTQKAVAPSRPGLILSQDFNISKA